jgi:hypothetical protein
MFDPLLAAAVTTLERERTVATTAGRPIIRRRSRFSDAIRRLLGRSRSVSRLGAGRSERSATDVGA